MEYNSTYKMGRTFSVVAPTACRSETKIRRGRRRGDGRGEGVQVKRACLSEPGQVVIVKANGVEAAHHVAGKNFDRQRFIFQYLYASDLAAS